MNKRAAIQATKEVLGLLSCLGVVGGVVWGLVLLDSTLAFIIFMVVLAGIPLGFLWYTVYDQEKKR